MYLKQPDPITATDRRQMKAARAEARERLKVIDPDDGGAMRDVLLREVGTTVRSVSPFLLSLVAHLGKSVDELVGRIDPSPRWPRSSSLSRHAPIEFRPVRDTNRYFLVSTASGWTKADRRRGFGPGTTFMRSDDDWAHLEIAAHSLEVEAWIGPVRFETLFGRLRIVLDDRLPDSLADACAGRLIGDVIDHPALRGQDWLIEGIDDSRGPELGQALIVATGSTAYRMPWMR